jgi:hypothetical protein
MSDNLSLISNLSVDNVLKRSKIDDSNSKLEYFNFNNN